MNRKVTKYYIPLFIIGIFIFLFTLWQARSKQNISLGIPGMSLTAPAFAQESETSFLYEEAGITAYTKLNQKIDLTRVKSAFRTLEKENDTYIIGSILVPGYEKYGKENLHCFVNKDGWLAVYYLENEPIAKATNWQNLSKTKLEMGLAEVCGTIGLGLPYVKYYLFNYPDATKIMVITKSQQRYCRIMIPSSFIVYERSWSTTESSGRNIEVDGKAISEKNTESKEYGTYGFATATQLGADVYHTIRPTSGNCAIVIAYRES